MIDEELVQLLTPEGERVENSEYESRSTAMRSSASIATW
jgi:hypothetical protein